MLQCTYFSLHIFFPSHAYHSLLWTSIGCKITLLLNCHMLTQVEKEGRERLASFHVDYPTQVQNNWKSSAINTKPILQMNIYAPIFSYLLPLVVYCPVKPLITTLILCTQNPQLETPLPYLLYPHKTKHTSLFPHPHVEYSSGLAHTFTCLHPT